MKSITPAELKNIHNAQLIDVRTQEEYERGHIPEASLIPHTQIEEVRNKFHDKDKKYILYCRTDGRSRQATEQMLQMGYSNTFFLKGGYIDWLEDK